MVGVSHDRQEIFDLSIRSAQRLQSNALCSCQTSKESFASNLYILTLRLWPGVRCSRFDGGAIRNGVARCCVVGNFDELRGDIRVKLTLRRSFANLEDQIGSGKTCVLSHLSGLQAVGHE